MQNLGKDDFLELLITKLQHQDPLSPMDDEDFIAQLAQFSSLEQMANISEGIATANQWDYLQMQSVNNMMASGLVGKEIKAEYDGVYLDANNQPVISFTTSEYAEDIEFVIRDSQNNIVATLTEENVQPGTGTITWDGEDTLGNRVEEGYYTIEAKATDGDGETFTPHLSLVGIVSSIVYRDGAAYLSVNGTEIPLGDVTAIGEPGAFTDTGDSDGSGDGSGEIEEETA